MVVNWHLICFFSLHESVFASSNITSFLNKTSFRDSHNMVSSLNHNINSRVRRKSKARLIIEKLIKGSLTKFTRLKRMKTPGAYRSSQTLEIDSATLGDRRRRLNTRGVHLLIELKPKAGALNSTWFSSPGL